MHDPPCDRTVKPLMGVQHLVGILLEPTEPIHRVRGNFRHFDGHGEQSAESSSSSLGK